MSLDDDAREELQALEGQHRLRVPRVLDGAQGPCITLDGQAVLSFASNDYLSLAGDARVARAAANALEDGVGAGASRLIIGNHRRHVAVEQAIGDWLRCSGVLLFSSGYAANVGVLTALLRPGDVVFSDELNHASIIDGCRLSKATIVIVPHLDISALERKVAMAAGRRRLVVSETLFSMDGDIADVEALAAVCRRHDAALMLDEAHAIGVWGPEGRGLAASRGIVPDIFVGTCGKALGVHGAFVASTRAVTALLWNRARPLVFSTGLPPMLASALAAAIEIVRGTDGELRRRNVAARATQLRKLVDRIRGDACSAIAPLLIGDDRDVMMAASRLLDEGIFVQGIRPPTVPDGTARLRIGISAGHSPEHIDRLASALLRLRAGSAQISAGVDDLRVVGST